MFYFLILILVLILFLIIVYLKGNRNHGTLVLLLLSYFAALITMIIYISKDTYYYNLTKTYFYLPNFIWRSLFFFNISKTNLVRLMNLSSLGIVIISIYFTFSFYKPRHRIIESSAKAFVWIYGAGLLLLYDPALNIKTYYFLYPDYMTAAQYRSLELLIESITRICNSLMVLSCMVCLLIALATAPKLKLFRFNYLFLCISYGIFSMVYVFFISSVPAFCLKISKISGTYTYRSIHLSSNSLFYEFLPFFLIGAAAFVTYCTYRLTRLTNQMSLNEFSISKEISSSETTSKIFCHYIKNEILALESELELLPDLEGNEILEDIKKRCQILYNRIDEIHRSTKTSALNLKLYSLQNLLDETLEGFSVELSDIKVFRDFPKQASIAFVDPVYMGQALHNIIRNSIDAMEGMPADKKTLSCSVKTNNNWVWIEIEDTGKGISKENLAQIFLPFYSSHPYSKHWGIGLTLTYKIIHAHEGKIDVTSTPGAGTSVRIILPLAQKPKNTYPEKLTKKELMI